MDSIRICGEVPLYGRLKVQGSKNAALPILAATVLIPGVSILHNCPRIEDVHLMCKLLVSVGCCVKWEGNTLIVDASEITEAGGQRPLEKGAGQPGREACRMPAEYVEKMRSSVIFMGAMLGRIGEISLKYPGGCVIGKRPIDLHLMAMEQLGVETAQTEEGVNARVQRLRGGHIRFPIRSVGATENSILAAACAEGTTILEHTALEPEIHALCEFLRSAGAEITGEETGRIRIDGRERLHGCEYSIPTDRIVTGTYLLACMAAGGEILLEGACRKELQALLGVLERMGAEAEARPEGILCHRNRLLLSPGEVVTEVYPGYPTDLQSPMLAVMAIARGSSGMTETIFENRFRVAEELNRMGAGICVEGRRAYVPGSAALHGEGVRARELRGGAALVVAGLAAQGETIVSGRQYIDRGYEDIVRDLRALGADISYEWKEDNSKEDGQSSA